MLCYSVHIKNIYLNQEFSQATSTSFIHIQISAKTIIYVLASNMWE